VPLDLQVLRQLVRLALEVQMDPDPYKPQEPVFLQF
jgi:hypothetical protein